MGVESQGVMPPRPEDFINIPEVPRSVTDGTRVRQEIAGDPLKAAATERKSKIRKSFPEVPDDFTNATSSRIDKLKEEGTFDETLDARRAKDLDEDEQERWGKAENFKL